MTSWRCFSLGVILSTTSGSKLRVQSGGSGSASRSLSHGVSTPPALHEATDKAVETPDDPSDKAEPETRMSDGLGLSRLKTDHSQISFEMHSQRRRAQRSREGEKKMME